MVISGNLKDIAFAEVVRSVGGQTGKLQIFNFKNNTRIEWFVYRQTITAVRTNGEKVPDKAAIFRLAAEHGADTVSSFIFYILSPERLINETALPTGEVIAHALAAAQDLSQLRGQFPHPQTKFVCRAEPDENLPFELRQIFNLCRLHPDGGISAADIAAKINQEIESVQFAYYKLRAANAIEPVRLIAHKIASAAPSEPEDSAIAAISSDAAHYSAPTQITTASGGRGSLVKRMLNAILLSKKD